jgi:hypothetical protein
MNSLNVTALSQLSQHSGQILKNCLEDRMDLIHKTIICPFCGHPTHITLDVSGEDQDDFEDCSNCCNPIHIKTHKDEAHHSVQVFIDADDEQIY